MKHDLSNLFIDFSKCPKGKKLSDFFTELSVWSEFTQCKDDRLIKIAILSGDIESDFVSITSRDQMLRAIFEFLNIDRRKDEKLLKSIEKYQNEEFMRIFYRYLFISNEMEFSLWLSLKADYSILMEQAAKPAPSDDKAINLNTYLNNRKNIRIQMQDLIYEIQKIEAKLFPDSRAARQLVITDKKIKVYAEKYAEEGGYL